MGIVYRGEDNGSAGWWRYKTLKENASADQRRDFLSEARAALSHPNIVTVFDFGEQDGDPYLVMEYLEGGSLKNTGLTPASPSPFSRNWKWFRQVCLGLGFAHQEGVVHRDIKPAT